MTKKTLLERALIGIEWEPQLTLLHHAQHQVLFEFDYVQHSSDHPFAIVKKVPRSNTKHPHPVGRISIPTKSFEHPNQVTIKNK